ncbi:MAG TPA: DUF3443 family protein [Myxococcaceae bacterium]|nr:DUF3443 family protein [Myxococcaceae bacterium]
MTRGLPFRIGWVLLAVVSSSCGDSSSGQSQGPPPNTLSMTIDLGPPALLSTGPVSANVAYATITVCSPGSTIACQSIDHVVVDTGSTGLRILHEVLSPSVVPRPVVDPPSGRPVSECGVFADGWTWGSLDTVDVNLGGRTISSLVAHVIGDPASGAAPSGCSAGNGPEEDTVADFGANGVLGVGYYLQDCGSYCAGQIPTSGAPFWACSGGGGDQGCTAITLAATSQPANLIALLPSDNNGLEVRFPSTGTAPAATLSGTLLFGIGTQTDNPPGSASFHVLAADGSLTTTYGGNTFDQSLVDSGSSAYYFADGSIAQCASSDVGTGFYCPPSAIDTSGTLAGAEVRPATIAFTVGNADQLFTTAPDAAVFPSLAGPLGGLQLSTRTFDWGLPFFYGRSVFVVFEGRVGGTTTGPAIGF